MTTLSVIVFIAVYVGMALGRIPGLAIDRTGVALLGLIALLATGDLTLDEAGRAVDMPTLTLLFALMILSAQFENSGFYAWVAERVTHAAQSPRVLLAVLVLATGFLSALLTNDVVVFALTPLVGAGLIAQGLDPRPYLVALAGAANAGSAGTLIGNPQNVLIGQAGRLPFWRYILFALPPTLVSLVAVYLAVLWVWRTSLDKAPAVAKERMPAVEPDRMQIARGLIAVIALIALFMTSFPRELSALAVAGLLLLSRRMSSRDMIGAVDWHLLLLFTCLFGVTAAFAKTGLGQDGLLWLEQQGLVPDRLSALAPLTLASSNTIGNVPAVILIIRLVPDLSHGALAGLALLSTFAGNLLLTGSMCNIIVAERAKTVGGRLSFADFTASGLVMTGASFAAACLWLWYTGLLPL
jgi:Na+/H+ antiporter NhaD/arsenite permease-like protein